MRGLLCAIVLAIGCKETLPIDVGAIDFDYGFLITYPETGVDPIRVSPTFGIEDGAVTFGEQPALDLDDQEQRFVFVALTAEQLHPSFERSRASELEALLVPPPEIALTVEGVGDNLNARIALPSSAQLLTAELEDASAGLRPIEESEFKVHGEITLRIPVEPEHCRIRGQTPLEPFAAAPSPIMAPVASKRIQDAFYLDRDTVLVGSRRYVYVIKRGATITSTHAGTVFGIVDDPDRLPLDNILDMAVSPPKGDGSREVLAVGGDSFDEKMLYGRIWSLRLRGESIELERPSQTILVQDTSCTATTDRLCDLRLLSVTYANDRFLAGGTDGDIFAQDPVDSIFRRTSDQLENRTDIPDSVIDIMPVAFGAYDMMVGMKNHIHLRRAADGRWEHQYVERSGVLFPEPLRFGTFAAIPGPNEAEVDYWTAGDRGQIARRTGAREWVLLSDVGRGLYYPPRFLPCASSDDPSGNPRGFNRNISVIEAFEDYVHMGHENCNALVVVRRSDQCVSLVAPKDQEPAFSTSFITSIDRLDRTLLIGTSAGDLYETTIPPP